MLFIKMYVERTGTHGTFTTEYLDQRDKTRLPNDPPVHEALFALTKLHYADDDLFADNETLDISASTFRRIVEKLQPFNLAATGDDVKGLAFEEFLGRTFRGELGQYFTPRPVVNFMVDLLNPREGELVCDPCAGSGGFLIRAFEHVRAQIEADVQAQKDVSRADIEAMGLSETEEEKRIEAAFAKANRELEIPPKDSKTQTRLGRLSKDCIFGTDAEASAARTAKMNMIMHGDGHGGIHYHDGLLDINGIFGGRFDVVLTNPPFGSTVGDDQKVGATEQSRVRTDAAYVERSRQRYGEAWEAAHQRQLKAIEDEAEILSLFEIGDGKPARATELLFVERAIQLLRPGGRLGIVLPDGNLNNPSLQWLRRWAEGRARLLAVVSLPEDTFARADATVKASLVFLRRFTAPDEAAWATAWDNAHAELDPTFAARRTALCEEAAFSILTADDPTVGGTLSALDALEAGRTPPGWRLAEPPPYPRGVVRTGLVNSRWLPLPKDKKAKEQALQQREAYAAAFSAEHQQRADDHARRLLRALRRLDRDHTAALWAHVRAAFDYPVFVAAPAAVGVDNGPDELPAVLADYRAFAAWVEAGADPATQPVFAE